MRSTAIEIGDFTLRRSYPIPFYSTVVLSCISKWVMLQVVTANADREMDW